MGILSQKKSFYVIVVILTSSSVEDPGRLAICRPENATPIEERVSKSFGSVGFCAFEYFYGSVRFVTAKTFSRVASVPDL